MPINVPPNPRRPREEEQLHRRTSHNYGRRACKSRSIKSWKVLEETRWNWRKNLQNWSKEILTGRKCGQVERFAVGLGHGLLLYFRLGNNSNRNFYFFHAFVSLRHPSHCVLLVQRIIELIDRYWNHLWFDIIIVITICMYTLIIHRWFSYYKYPLEKKKIKDDLVKILDPKNWIILGILLLFEKRSTLKKYWH